MNSRFHHRSISRIKAETLLIAKGKEGSFLVRDSETTQGAYTLCLLDTNHVMKQYRILPDEHGMLHIQAVSGVERKFFANISALIEYYMNRGIHNGLGYALSHPVPVQDDSDEDEDDYECSETRLTSIDGSIDPAALFADAPQLSAAVSQLSDASTLQSLQPAGLSSTTKASAMPSYFQQRFQQLDLSHLDGGFVNKLREYSETGVVEDGLHVLHGTHDTARHLHTLLNQCFLEVQKAVDLYVAKMDTLRELFAPLQTAKLLESLPKQSQGQGLQHAIDSTVERIKCLRSPISNLQHKAVSQFKKFQNGEAPKNDVTPPRPPKTGTPKAIPEMHYKVRLVKHGRAATPMMLTVDVTQGKVLMAKTSSTAQKFTDVVTPEKVTQLVKSTKNNKVLDLHILGQRMQGYEFESVRYRESFCQMVQQMKLQHSGQQELQSLTLFIGTWNTGDSSFPSPLELENWLTCQGTGKSRERELRHQVFDMYVLGFQEMPLREDKLVKKIQEVFSSIGLDNEIQLVASKTLWSIGIVVFIKAQFKHKVFYLETASEATGIANALGNKGGVGVSFNINGTSLCFVCAHLAARQDASRNERRNQNYRDIIKGMRNLGSKKLNNVVDLTNKFHHVFFLGDLNYRIADTNTQQVLLNIKNEEYATLLHKDQLTTTQRDGRAFVDFREEEITFPPTYRIKKGSLNEYVIEKLKKTGIRYNTPSWCDRVLWRSYPGLYISNSSYGSVEDVCTSDHKPVFASFQLGIAPTSVTCSAHSGAAPQTYIVLDHVSAQVLMNNKELLTLEFHSPILEQFKTSKKNKQFEAERKGYCSPMWVASDFDKLKPNIGDVEYLEEQHVILVVKSEDNMEAYGEAVISLKDKCTSTPVSFKCTLTHQGEETGNIWGSLHMEGVGMDRAPKPRRRDYELVMMDVDAYGDVAAPLGRQPLADEIYSQPIDDHERKEMAASQCASSAGSEMLYEAVSYAASSSNNLQLPTSTAVHRKSAPEQQVADDINHSNLNTAKKESVGEKQATGVVRTKQARGVVRTTPAHRGANSDRSYQNVHVLPKAAIASFAGSRTSDVSTGTKRTVTQAPPAPQSSATHARQPPPQSATHARQPPPQSCGPRVQTATALLKQTSVAYTNSDVGGTVAVEHTDGQVATPNQNRDNSVDVTNTGKWPASLKGKPNENPVYECDDTAVTSHTAVAEEQYEILEGPVTVQTWLRGLDLAQYTQVFLDNGWDRIEFLNNMTKQDLIDLSIHNQLHHTRILNSIRIFKKSITK